MNINWLKTLNLFATFETIPDLTFYLDIPVDIIPQRQTGNLDRFEEEGLTFLNKVRSAMEETEGVSSVLVGEARRQAGLDHERSGDLVAISDEDAW